MSSRPEWLYALPEGDPRHVGGRYHSYHWGEEYTVTAVRADPAGKLTAGSTWDITVRWASGELTTHCTPWDSDRDKIISD